MVGGDQLELDVALRFDEAEASIAADAGMALADQADRVQEWKATAVAWLEGVELGRELTADELVAAVGLPDRGVARNNVVGAIFSALSRRGVLAWTGRYSKSERVIGHGNLQRVWRRA